MYRVTELHRREELSYGNVLQEQKFKHPINLSFAEAHRRLLAPGTLARYVTGQFHSPKIPWNGLWKHWKATWLELSFVFTPWGDTAHVQVTVHILWLHASDHEAVPLPTPCCNLNFWLWEEMNQWKSSKTTFLTSHISAKELNQAMDWFLWAWKPCSQIVEFSPFKLRELNFTSRDWIAPIATIYLSYLKSSLTCSSWHTNTTQRDKNFGWIRWSLLWELMRST